MAKIDKTALTDWNNGDIVKEDGLEKDFEVLRVALNATDDEVKSNKTHSDGVASRVSTLESKYGSGVASAIQEYTWTPTEGQTVFTLPSGQTYAAGYIDVIVGGVLQTDVIESSGTTFTLAEGVPAGVTEVYAKWFQGVALASSLVPSITDMPGYSTNVDDRIGSLSVFKTQTESVFILATQLGMVDNDPTKAVQNYNLLNEYLNGGSNRTVFLNGDKFWISQKLVMTQPFTSILGGNKGRSVTFSCLVGDFADTLLEINIASGSNGSYLDGIALDGQDVATTGLKIANGNFSDNHFENIVIRNINGIALHVDQNNYSSVFRKVIGSDSLIGLQIESLDNQHIAFRDCGFNGDNYGAIVGTDSADGLRNVHFDNCEFYSSNNAVVKINKTLYNIKFSNCWLERASGSSTGGSIIEMGSPTNAANGVTFDTIFLQGNGKVDYAISWVRATYITFMGQIRHLSTNLGFIDASTTTLFEATSIMQANTNIPFASALNGAKIDKLFRYWYHDSSLSAPQQKTMIFVDPDGQSSAAPNAKPIRVKRSSEAQDRFYMTEQGLYFGDGVTAPDTRILRTGAKQWSFGNDNDVVYGGTWDKGHPVLGTYHLWVDATGALRIKNGKPTTDLDGTVVGLQT